MKNLYVVESPLQILNAFEAIHAFPATDHSLFVRYAGSQESDKQINDIIKKLNLNSIALIKHVSINGEKRTLIDIFKLFIFKILFLFKSKGFDRIFLGNFGSPFMQFIIPNHPRIILLDDGAASINTQNNFSPTNFKNWFTLFDFKALPNQVITQNTYQELKKLIPSNITQSQETVLFIGSKLSEAGIISEEYYLELMQKISKRFSNKKIIYIPHRGESPAKLDRLINNANISITTLDYPIELLSVYGDITPKVIVSFYSTALITLSKIYKVDTIAIKFDYSSSKHKKAIEQTYNYCSKYMPVIEEENI